MNDYWAPVRELMHGLTYHADLPGLHGIPGNEGADPHLVRQILEEAGKLAAHEIAPLNFSGDREGARLVDGQVRTPAHWAEAYRKYREAGWNALPFEPAYGGHGMPWAVAMTLEEIWHGANTAWALLPLLNVGGVELLQAHGSPWQRQTFLPKMIAGEWTGTMNLTEPQAGSDVGALKTRAVPEGEHYRITGQKIYITFGEHDMSDNIVHMVLARTPGAPRGTKGISLFIVPRYLPDADGRPGVANDLRCLSIEDKMGIHGAPTCTMAFGDEGGAVGYLVGEECRGMAQMFTMMNNARLNVGIQGIGIAERAYQAALSHARQRVQSRDVASRDPAPVPIVSHPDVRRMLLSMRSRIAAQRALALYAGGLLDRAKQHPDPATRERAQARVDLLTPVVKACGSDLGVEASSLAVQIHGGMGYVEDAGVAQHYRDARIAPIYEGTNGIQALDLVMRKVLRDDGASLRAFLDDLREMCPASDALGDTGQSIPARLKAAVDRAVSVSDHVRRSGGQDPALAAAQATPLLELIGTVAGGVLIARGAAAARLEGDDAFARGQTQAAAFYATSILPRTETYAAQVFDGGETVRLADPDAF